MSNAKPRPVAEINLEEFERRLRAAAAPQAGVEDPLAELTRLVDSIGFERSASEKALEASRAARPAPAPPPPPPPRAESKPELRLAPEAAKPALEAPKPPPPAPAAPPQLAAPSPPAPEPPPAPVAAQEPEWPEAPPAPDPEPALRPSFHAEDLDSFAFDPPTPSEPEPVAAVDAPPGAAPPEAAGPPARARNWGLKVGGLVAAGVLMIGAVVVFKIGGVGHSGAPPLILASTAPTKVAPPNEETIRTANESGSLLTRDTAQPTPTPPKLVNPPEAPVDLSARPQPSASPEPAVATPAASASADASPVAPSSETPIVAAATPKATPVSPVGSDPSRVRTISVRPDGTLIASGYESAQVPLGTTPAPAATPQPKAAETADGEAATPAVALPTKLAPPKSAARVVNKTDTTAPADPGAGPVPVKPKKPKPTPVATPVAEAEPKTDDATAPAAPSGGYAVQLAAPKSESEAKALVRSLPGRYSAALAGASLGVRKAERDGEAIYRVRAFGLSKDEAKAMCAKVKSAGGDCYVAKN